MKALNDPRELSLKFIVLGSLWAMAVSLGATYAESPKPTASFDEVWQSYQSRWRKPEIQARIAEGIEKHRKQD
ncbi:MAG TPA: hypothetical protein PLS55_04645, partial [Thermogutta sp.]|nr:hypothetical protein [Thermogutta sp.]